MDAQAILSVILLGAGALGAGEGWRRWWREREAHNKLKVRTQELLIRYKAIKGELDDEEYTFGGVEDEPRPPA